MSHNDLPGWVWPVGLIGGAIALSGDSDGADDPSDDPDDPGDGVSPVEGQVIERHGSSNQTADVTVYSTENLKSTNGRAPERAAATYVANAFDAIDVSVRVHYDLPVQSPPTEDAGCGGGTALSWWQQRVVDDDLPLAAPAETGSNVLLTADETGGCGAVCGRSAVAPGGPITAEPSYEVVGTGMDQWALHVVLHEVSHNFCSEHDADDVKDGNQHYGMAYNDSSRGLWVRTPEVAGAGVANACGNHVFAPTFERIGYRQAFTECFRRHMKIE